MSLYADEDASRESLSSDGDAYRKSLSIDEDAYPCCAPSSLPPVTDIARLQWVLEQAGIFDETRCDVLDASAKGCSWRHDVDDQGLKEYLVDCKAEVSTINIVFRSPDCLIMQC